MRHHYIFDSIMTCSWLVLILNGRNVVYHLDCFSFMYFMCFLTAFTTFYAWGCSSVGFLFITLMNAIPVI